MKVKDQILALGHLNSIEIADRIGCSSRYARRVLREAGLSKPAGARPGQGNHQWKGGRMIDLDGYVVVQTRPTRILEHRVIAARMLERPLTELEVVDHVDGITIHNDPSNLRVFETNGEHLRNTACGPRLWSVSGRAQMGNYSKSLPRIDTYHLRKKRGDVRLRAILRCALELGKDSPYLLGTRHWLLQAGIDPDCYHSLELGLTHLNQRWEQDLCQ